MEKDVIKSIIESLTFVSGDPVKVSRIMKILNLSKEEVFEAVHMLEKEYSQQKRGLMLLVKGDEIQMVSNPENAPYIEQLVKGELQDSLSNAALEVLSIIAYKGPIAKTEIEAIRGVNCSYTVRNLLMRGLIERNDNPKDQRGFVYVVSFEFLKKLGISKVENLPQYDILSKDERIDSVVEKVDGETQK